MATLTTRTAKINVVLSLKGYDIKKTLDRLKEFCVAYMQVYAFILHDRDILENGESKTPHIHLIGLMNNNRQRLGTILTEICESCELEPFAITIDKMSDIVGSIQYLIHKNNAEKYQYDVGEIITNLSESELMTYLNSDSKSISIEYLVSVIEKNRSRIDIMREIGLTYYHLYRNTINDIYREIWENVFNN